MDKTMADMYADPAGMTAEMEQIFKSKTRNEWMALFEGRSMSAHMIFQAFGLIKTSWGFFLPTRYHAMHLR